MNVAVIGLGYWGPNLLRNIYELHRTDRLIACDLDPNKIQKIQSRYPAIETEIDYRNVLADPRVDAVFIATPVSFHASLGEEALRAGKHIFVEKPLAASVKEVEELIETAKTKNKILMVGHTFEYSPPVLKIKEILSSGQLGDIYYLSSSRVNLGLHQKDVSVIWDLAPHDFSTIFFWLDEEPNRISAAGKDFVQKGIPDVAFINLEFPSGAIAHVQVSWLSPSKLRRTTIVGSEKMLVYDDTENIEKVKIYDKGVDYKDPETFGEYQLSYRTGDVVSPKLDTYEPLRREMEHFLNCCETGEKPKTDGYNGLRVVKALELAEESLRSGGRAIEL
ncbi:glucose--fructose oxidoreductase precursor [bacterium BMS3Abin05]|nr:glucose--fructose oxidoreductase precursor [bacterium BMS3Abin05]GBE28689.1 glucose--fructose oxidoreductase precursor [bacterium BMS3Bbin03]HDZ10935.1 Gfo/Idh/MocA family oxidoreductase [Bacteroidota bacterium]